MADFIKLAPNIFVRKSDIRTVEAPHVSEFQYTINRSVVEFKAVLKVCLTYSVKEIAITKEYHKKNLSQFNAKEYPKELKDFKEVIEDEISDLLIKLQ